MPFISQTLVVKNVEETLAMGGRNSCFVEIRFQLSGSQRLDCAHNMRVLGMLQHLSNIAGQGG